MKSVGLFCQEDFDIDDQIPVVTPTHEEIILPITLETYSVIN